MRDFMGLAGGFCAACVLVACGGGSGGNSGADNGGGTPPADIITPVVNISNQRIKTRRYDTDNDGVFEIEEHFTYDVDGKLQIIDFAPTQGFSSFATGELPFSFGGNKENTVTFTYTTEDQVSTMSVIIFDRDISGARVVERNNEFSYKWDRDTFMVTEVEADFFTMDNGGGLASTLKNVIDNDGQRVRGWTDISTTIVPTQGVPDVTVETNIALTYGANGLPETYTQSFDNSPSSNVFTYTWNDAGLATKRSETRTVGSFSITSDKEYTYTPQNNIASRTTFIDGDQETQTIMIYDANNRLERITYADKIGNDIDTVIEIEWEDGLCRPAMIWAGTAEPSFIAAGNEPYLPATGYFQLNYCYDE